MSTTTTTWLLQLRDRITAPLRNVRGRADQAGDAMERAQSRAATFGNTLKRLAITFAGVTALSGTIKAAAEVEQTNVAFEVLLGNVEKGKKIAAGLTAFANVTPYNAENLQNAAKTMLGFGLSAEHIMPNLKALGNIAMGDANKLSSLTLAFSQASSTGKLTGQDLLQMINAGFNPLEEISRKTGKSISILKDEMSKGRISADMVRESFLSAAGAGGRFGGMMERMADTTKGTWATMTGQFKQAGVEIGQKLLPITNKLLNTGLKIANFLQRHASSILKVVSGVGVLIGVIKAVSIATSLWTARFALLNSVMVLNPIIVMIGLVAGLTTAVIAFNKSSTTAAKVQGDFTRKLLETRRELDNDFFALRKTKEGTDERREAIENINAKYGDYLTNLLTEKSTLEDIAKAQDEATAGLIRKIAIQSQEEQISKVISESINEQQAAFDRIMTKIASRVGQQKAGEIAPKVHDIISKIEKSPNVWTDFSDDEKKLVEDYNLRFSGFSLNQGQSYFTKIRLATDQRKKQEAKINQFFNGILNGFNLNENKTKRNPTGGSGNDDTTGIQLSGAGGGRGGVTMNVTMNNTFNVGSDMDIKTVAEQIFRMINDRLRDGLVTATN